MELVAAFELDDCRGWQLQVLQTYRTRIWLIECGWAADRHHAVAAAACGHGAVGCDWCRVSVEPATSTIITRIALKSVANVAFAILWVVPEATCISSPAASAISPISAISTRPIHYVRTRRKSYLTMSLRCRGRRRGHIGSGSSCNKPSKGVLHITCQNKTWMNPRPEIK